MIHCILVRTLIRCKVDDRRTDRTDLVVRPILYFEIVADASGLENLTSRRTTDTVDTVSYTHLDVYKRQAQTRKGAEDEGVTVDARPVVGEPDIHDGLQFRSG